MTINHLSDKIDAALSTKLISAEKAVMITYYRDKTIRNVSINKIMITVEFNVNNVKFFFTDMNDEITIVYHNSFNNIIFNDDTNVFKIVKIKIKITNIFAKYVKTNEKIYHNRYIKSIFVKYIEFFQQIKDILHFNLSQQFNAIIIFSIFNFKIINEFFIDKFY